MGESKLPRLLTVRQASLALGVPCWRLYEVLARGTGPRCMRLGRTYRISEVELVRWIESRHGSGGGGSPAVA